MFFLTLYGAGGKDWIELEPHKLKGWIETINKVYKGMEYFDSLEMESVSIFSREGFRLSGKYYPKKNSKKTMICFHGFRSKAKIDFGASSKFYHNQGFNLLFVDQRSCGNSEGRYIAMGTLERYDCLEWVDYIMKRSNGETDIYLAGVSMGATSIILAAGLGLPKNVKGIIADCGFTSPYEIFKHTLKYYFKLPEFPVLNISALIFRIKLGYWIKKINTVEVLKNIEIPILFIHGNEDRFVPIDMTLKNYEACNSNKEIFISEGAWHGLSYITNPKLYEKAVKEFLWHNRGSTLAGNWLGRKLRKGQEEGQ